MAHVFGPDTRRLPIRRCCRFNAAGLVPFASERRMSWAARRAAEAVGVGTGGLTGCPPASRGA